MKQLTKGNDRKLCGVCSGLANYMDLDTSLVRIVYACLTLFSCGFPGVLLYVILALFMKDAE